MNQLLFLFTLKQQKKSRGFCCCIPSFRKLKMITPTMILILIVIHFFLPSISAVKEPKHNPTCTPFHCGSLGNTSFPFSNITHPDCGLYVINCTGQTPTIDLKGGRQYEVKNIFNNEITIHDTSLKHQLDNKNCNLYENEFRLPPATPSISFELRNPNLTLIKCPSPLQDIPFEVNTYEGCKDDYLIHYIYPEQDKLSQLPKSRFVNCSVVQLPLKIDTPPPPDGGEIDLFALFSDEFFIGWTVSEDCVECFSDGGQCLENNRTKEFQCSTWQNGCETNICNKPNVKRKVAIGIGSAVGGSLLTMILVFFLFRRWRRKNKFDTSTTLISRSISPDHPMKPDPEKGSSYFQTPIFTYKELEEATNNFDSTKELGDGSFGTVYHGELRDGRVVAIKRLYENNCKRVEQFMNEVTILSLLRHQNLVTLYGCTSRHSRELLLVYEYVPNGTVADHLHGEQANSGLLTWPIRMTIAIESAGALAYLHASDIIHRDVKTNNILLDNYFHVKVADFGLSRLFPTDVTHVSTAPQGTPGYVDPEYYQCYKLTDKSDVYSFGVILIELISSMPAVDINRHRHEINLSNMAINNIHNHALHELVDSSLGFETDPCVRRMIALVAELAFRCLQQETEMRPTMAEVVEVLKGIQSEGSKVLKGVEVDIPAEDVQLSKNNQPLSPDSATEKRVIVSGTPNTSS